MKQKVFIHTNHKQLLGALVAAQAIRKSARDGAALDVEILKLEEHLHLSRRHGDRFLREGRRERWNNEDLQSFTPLRFLPPQLMGYRGRALVVDPDVFALADVRGLLDRDMGGKAILCRRIAPGSGRPTYFASSVMLLDCGRLRHWRWEEQIDALFDFSLDYRDWMSLQTEDPSSIGGLEEEWNHFDTLTDGTRLLHNTNRITQPWKTGLAVDFLPKQPPGRKWGVVPEHRWRGFRSWLRGRGYRPYGSYKRHPDPAQEKLFFTLLGECMEEGALDEAFLRTEIRKKHLRSDALDLMASLRSA